MLDTQPAGATSEDVWIPTACDMCYNVCAIRVHRVNGVAVKIEGIPEAPPNYGKICAKGNAGLMNLYNSHNSALTASLARAALALSSSNFTSSSFICAASARWYSSF